MQSVSLFGNTLDIRKEAAVEGRSINLALSARGIEALKMVGLDQIVIQAAIPMGGRMIHDMDGRETALPYGDFGEVFVPTIVPHYHHHRASIQSAERVSMRYC